MRKVALVAFLAALPAWPQTVAVKPSAIAGLELIGSQAPEFQTALEGVVGASYANQLSAWRPFLVVLRNHTPRTVAAYHLVWRYDNVADEEVVSNGGVDFRPDLMYALRPGAAVVASPGFNLYSRPTPEFQGVVDRQTIPPPPTSITIELDSALFTDGQFAGPDTQHHFDREAAAFSAWRPIDLKVQSRMAAGDPSDAAVSYLRDLSQGSTGGFQPADRAGWMNRAQIAHARLLYKLYQRSGAQALRDTVEAELRLPEAELHR